MSNRISRYTHVGKSSGEKAAYRDFLQSKLQLEKTVADTETFKKSDESPVEIDEVGPKKPKQRKGKSWKLVVADAINNNLGAAIFGGLIVAAILGVTTVLFNLTSDSRVMKSQLDNMDESISEIKRESINNKDSLSDLDNFVRDLAKDLEFLTEKVNWNSQAQ